MLALFYGEWGFTDTRGVYRLSDALWLDQVLKNRQGSAVSLGAILLWIANRLSLPLVPVIFPTQLILRIESMEGEMWLINPFNGETLNEHTLEVWLKGNISPVAELFNEDLDEADNAEVIRKLLDTLKSSLMEEQQMELALRASEALLQLISRIASLKRRASIAWAIAVITGSPDSRCRCTSCCWMISSSSSSMALLMISSRLMILFMTPLPGVTDT